MTLAMDPVYQRPVSLVRDHLTQEIPVVGNDHCSVRVGPFKHFGEMVRVYTPFIITGRRLSLSLPRRLECLDRDQGLNLVFAFTELESIRERK
jgi:hypothetical protein